MFGFSLVKVQGQSMEPMFPHGSFLLIHSAKSKFSYTQGQQIVFRHNKFGLLVKTVACRARQGVIWVTGENSASMSVEQIGPVSIDNIIGRVLFTIRPSLKWSPKLDLDT